MQLKKIEYREKVQYFLSLTSESETHILYRFITHRWNILSIYYYNYNFDDYGLQIMKTQISVSQKIRILHKINKKNDILKRNVSLLKSMLIYRHSILGWVSFCLNYCISAVWQGGDQTVALLRANGSPGCFDSGLQVTWIVGFGFSHLPLDNTPEILYGVQVRRVCWPIKHSNTMVIEPAFGTFGSVGRWQDVFWTSVRSAIFPMIV